MSEQTRRRIRISPFRKNMCELMRLARNIPLVTAERRMNLAELVEARKASALRPSWTVIFSKAFATVSARRPELRTCYMSFPYPHFYEHPSSSAMVIVEREYRGERFPMNYRLRKTDQSTLLELHQQLEHYRTGPLETDENFRIMRRLGRTPNPFCRLLWWLGYHWTGSRRARYFGTFGLSSPAIGGAGLTTILSPLTCTLHYSLFNDSGEIDMRITFDHRAIDGAPVARALTEMEQVLATEVLAEIKRLPKANQAA